MRSKSSPGPRANTALSSPAAGRPHGEAGVGLRLERVGARPTRTAPRRSRPATTAVRFAPPACLGEQGHGDEPQIDLAAAPFRARGSANRPSAIGQRNCRRERNRGVRGEHGHVELVRRARRWRRRFGRSAGTKIPAPAVIATRPGERGADRGFDGRAAALSREPVSTGALTASAGPERRAHADAGASRSPKRRSARGVNRRPPESVARRASMGRSSPPECGSAGSPADRALRCAAARGRASRPRCSVRASRAGCPSRCAARNHRERAGPDNRELDRVPRGSPATTTPCRPAPPASNWPARRRLQPGASAGDATSGSGSSARPEGRGSWHSWAPRPPAQRERPSPGALGWRRGRLDNRRRGGDDRGRRRGGRRGCLDAGALLAGSSPASARGGAAPAATSCAGEADAQRQAFGMLITTRCSPAGISRLGCVWR